MDIRCKRIIDGKTYNTETATQIEGWAETNHEPWPHEIGEFLYQNRFGAFFRYTFRDSIHPQDDYEVIEPYTPEQARSWLEKNCSYRVDLIEALFGNMPEAGSGESKFTLRMPDSLRERLAERAKANHQSLNAWIVRCLEACAVEPVVDADGLRDIPPMGGLVGSNRDGWRPKGT